MDESDEVDDEGNEDDDGESDISSEEDEENLIHTNGIKKYNQHLGIHSSNVDLLGIDGQPGGDSYLQTMNDNLHKKFRRQNHQYTSLHETEEDFQYKNNQNQIYHANPLNGDYKNNFNKSTIGNGPTISTGENNNNDDDDDIVLVSDDDSVEKKLDTKTTSINSKKTHTLFNHIHLDLPPPPEPILYAPTTFTEIVTVKSTTTTTLLLNDGLHATDLLQDIERV